MPSRICLAVTLLFFALSGAGGAERDPLTALDFWIGGWEVHAPTGEKIGTNRIEKILHGHALLEHWRDRDGREGKSLFYYRLGEKRWKQVWVTDEGPSKEKAATDAPEGSVRFQGPQRSADGTREWLDRTTLTARGGDSVEQVIEISTDQGASWRQVFIGQYRRVKPAAERELSINKINWFQIPASDLERAMKFYRAVLGWEFQRQEDAMGRHAFINSAPGSLTGEIVQSPNAKPSLDGLRLFLSADNEVAHVLRRAEWAGGRVLMPATSLGPMGVIGLIVDTEGNQVGVHGSR